MRQSWAGLGWTAAGIVVGFPLFSALALEGTPVAQSAILMGLLPLATTTYAVMRERVHPPVQFWLSRLAGMMAVVLFALGEGVGHVQAGDGWMLLAVGTGAVGYAEGGRLARELGGWRVICWALVFAVPFLVVPVGWSLVVHGMHSNLWAWLCLAYVSIFSMFLGFFAVLHDLDTGLIRAVGITPANVPEASVTPEISAYLEQQGVRIKEFHINRLSLRGPNQSVLGRHLLYPALGKPACLFSHDDGRRTWRDCPLKR